MATLLTNYVPIQKQNGCARRMEYEVVVFHTEFERDIECKAESEVKKRIWAKFRVYEDALEYAEKLVLRGHYVEVSIRA